MESKRHPIDNLEIEPLSDEALELVGGGDDFSSDGPRCCSCSNCSIGPKPVPLPPVIA